MRMSADSPEHLSDNTTYYKLLISGTENLEKYLPELSYIIEILLIQWIDFNFTINTQNSKGEGQNKGAALAPSPEIHPEQ